MTVNGKYYDVSLPEEFAAACEVENRSKREAIQARCDAHEKWYDVDETPDEVVRMLTGRKRDHEIDETKKPY